MKLVIVSVNGLNVVAEILKLVKNLVVGLIAKREDHAVENLESQEVVTQPADLQKLNAIKLKVRCIKRPVLKGLTGKKEKRRKVNFYKN
jgi:hypothetical protein